MAEPQEQLQSILEGALAYGWPYKGSGKVDVASEPLRGWLRLTPDGSLEFEALVDDPWGHQTRQLTAAGPTVPKAMFLSTRHAAVLLPNIQPGVGSYRSMGGSRASVNIYRARTGLFGLEADDVKSNQVDQLAVRFFGMGPWAGMKMTDTKVTYTSDGLVSSAELKLQSSPEQRLERRLPKSMTLVLEGDWVLGNETQGQREVMTGLRVVVQAKRPRPVEDMLAVLGDIQDLLGILRGGLTLASPTNLRTGKMAPSLLFWNSDLMRHEPRAVLAPERSDLRLSLSELGGLPGLAHWCRLAESHRDVVYALTSLYREGPTTVDASLIRLGVAIEVWVARNARSKWANSKKRPRGWTYAHGLAYHLGPTFAAFVGDADLWSTRLTNAYNDAKHNTGRPEQPELDFALARTARLALAAELLNRASGSRKTGAAWLQDWRHEQIGEHYRSLP
jgi:hypothetical protein